jgi:hypothetical protein
VHRKSEKLQQSIIVPVPSIYVALHCNTVGMTRILCESWHLLACPGIHSHMTATIPPPPPTRVPIFYETPRANLIGEAFMLRGGMRTPCQGHQELNLLRRSKDHSFTIAPRTPLGNALIYKDLQKSGDNFWKLTRDIA